MELASSTFRDGGEAPVRSAMEAVGGHCLSPQSSRGRVPAATRPLALSIVDKHPIAGNRVRWPVIDIPRRTASLAEGASMKKMPRGSRERRNSFGDIGYGGPRPPEGKGDHDDAVTLNALRVDRRGLGGDTSLSAFNRAIEGKVIGSARLAGRYQR